MAQTLFPILATPDLERSVAFYTELLGGSVDYRFPADGPAGYVSVRIQGSALGIGLDPSAATGPQRLSLWLYVENCDRTVDRIRAHGVPVLDPPTDQEWGERIARVTDPDGNLLTIATAPGEHPDSGD